MEAEDYNSEEEKLNNNWEAIGPRMIDFGHIGPDKEDLRVECKYSSTTASRTLGYPDTTVIGTRIFRDTA